MNIAIVELLPDPVDPTQIIQESFLRIISLKLKKMKNYKKQSFFLKILKSDKIFKIWLKPLIINIVLWIYLAEI